MKQFLLYLFISLSLTSQAQWAQIGQTILGDIQEVNFGDQVSLSDDGTTLAVSTRDYSSVGMSLNGRVQVFRNINNVWTQIGQSLYGIQNDESLGNSLSLSADGNILAIGSEYGSTNARGRVTVYQFTSDTWTQMGVELVGTQDFGLFGKCVSLSDDGMNLGVARYGFNGSYGAHMYEFDGVNYVNNGGGNSQYNVSCISMSGDGNTLVYGGQNWMHPSKKIDGTWTTLSNISVASTGINGGSNYITISGDGNVWAWGAELNSTGGTNAGRIQVIDMTNPDQWEYNFIYGTSFQKLGKNISFNYDGSVLAAYTKIFEKVEGVWTNTSSISTGSTSVCIDGSGSRLAVGYIEYTDPELGQIGNAKVFGDLPNTPPTIDCPDDLIVSNDPGECGAIVTLEELVANDLEDGTIIALQTDGILSGSLFPIGISTVQFTATDIDGLSVVCEYDVIVEDNELPNAVCNNIGLELDENGVVSYSDLDLAAESTDNCGPVFISDMMFDYSCQDLGVTTVEVTVTDGAGNENTCTSTVTILDLSVPVALCNNLTVELDENGMASITPFEVEAGSSDNCGIDSYGLDNMSFDCNDLGEQTVVLTVFDIGGHQSSCNSTITVVDSILPVLICPEDTLISIVEGSSYVLPDYFDLELAMATDNCGALETLSQSPAAGELLPPGEHTVTFTATDSFGNTVECDFNLSIESFIGLNELDKSEIHIYPNPNDGRFVLSIDSELQGVLNLEVYDLRGRKLISKQVQNQSSIELNGLAIGEYLVRIISEESVFTQKLMIQK